MVLRFILFFSILLSYNTLGLSESTSSKTQGVAEGISAQEAVRIAQKICKKEGLPWDNLGIDEKEGMWVIKTSKYTNSAISRIYIDQKTGKVVRKSFKRG